MNQPELILGSSSPYRRELLERLRLPFTVVSPKIDETPKAGETPPETALRLALEKRATLRKVIPMHSSSARIRSLRLMVSKSARRVALIKHWRNCK